MRLLRGYWPGWGKKNEERRNRCQHHPDRAHRDGLPGAHLQRDAVGVHVGAVMEGKLKDASQELLEAAQKFWEISQEERGGSAVVWVEDVEGRCFIFTRGEYRHQLLAEVHKLDLPTAFFINEEEEEDVLPCQVKMNGRRCRLAQVQIMRRGQNLRGMCSLHVAVAEAGSVDGDLNECDPGFVHWHRRNPDGS